MTTITDVHTHHSGNPSAIYNLTSPVETAPAGPVSVGLHPWDTALPDVETLMQAINHRAVTDVAVVAIGETGLDNRRGAPLSRQEQLLVEHIRLAELTHKPLILHIVGAWGELLRLHRDMRPSVPWIIHGFRGRPALARQLLDAGMYLSLGRHYNPSTALIIPSDLLLLETDEADSPPVPPPHYDPTLATRLFRAGQSPQL